MADPMLEKQESPAEATESVSEFRRLLDRDFKPKTDRAREEIERAAQTLMRRRSPAT